MNYLVMRHSPQWRAFNIENTREFLARIKWPEEMIVDFAAGWNACLGMNFLEFRARVKEISIENFLNVENSALLFLQQFNSGEAIGRLERSLDDDDILLFSDDDDWFHPEIFAVIQQRISQDGCYWDHVHTGLIEVDVPQQKLKNNVLCKRDADTMLFTNNYALTGRAVKRLGFDGVMEHYNTQTEIREQRIKINPVRLHLSASNKHPCSSTAIYLNRTEPAIFRDIRSHVARYYGALRNIELDDDTEWLRPQIGQMTDLVSQVLR